MYVYVLHKHSDIPRPKRRRFGVRLFVKNKYHATSCRIFHPILRLTRSSILCSFEAFPSQAHRASIQKHYSSNFSTGSDELLNLCPQITKQLLKPTVSLYRVAYVVKMSLGCIIAFANAEAPATLPHPARVCCLRTMHPCVLSRRRERAQENSAYSSTAGSLGREPMLGSSSSTDARAAILPSDE